MLTALAGKLQDPEIASRSRSDSDLPSWGLLLEQKLGTHVRVVRQLAGGASKETWEVDTDSGILILRCAGGGSIYADALTLEDEFRVMEAASQAGVRVPRVISYIADLDGREAFAMERVSGMTIGKRVVREPSADLDVELVAELAKIHSIDRERLPFLPERPLLDRMNDELDLLPDAYPAIEYGLSWLTERCPSPMPFVVSHGDFRIGNVAVSKEGLVAILDWEFARVSDPREDLSWPLLRAWRFGVDHRHLGGIGTVDRYLTRYGELTGYEVQPEDLDWWEVAGNVRWAIASHAQARRHLSGKERNVELALIGRKAAEVEYEILDLIERFT